LDKETTNLARGLLAALSIGFAVNIAITPDLLTAIWCNVLMVWRDQTAAAWAQGIGTVASVIGALWIARRQSRETEAARSNTRLHEAQGLTILLMGITKQLSIDIQDAILQQNPSNHTVVLPESIMRRADKLWVMGKAGGGLLQAIAVLERNNDFIQRATVRPLNPGSEIYREIFQRSVDSLKLAHEGCEESLSHMEKLLFTRTL